MKKIKWGNLLSGALMLAAGILLVIYPETSADIVLNVVGIGSMIYGVIEIIVYFTLNANDFLKRDDLVIGMLCLLIGLLFIFKKDLVKDILPIALGLMILISGLSKVQAAVVAKRIGYEASLSYLLLGVISIVFGLVIMFGLSGDTAAKTLFTVIGIGLIFSGASDLFVSLFLSGKYKQFMKQFENKISGKVVNAETSNEHVVDEDETKGKED